MKINKILWATDGSKEADSALKYATFFAEKFGSEILCLSVTDINFPITSLYAIPDKYITEIAEKSEKRLGSKLKRINKKLSGEGIESVYQIIRDETT